MLTFRNERFLERVDGYTREKDAGNLRNELLSCFSKAKEQPKDDPGLELASTLRRTLDMRSPITDRFLEIL